MRKVFLLISAFILLLLNSYAAVPVRYRVNGVVGGITHGSIIDKWIGSRPVLGGEVAVEFLPTGKLESLQWYNNASIGIAFSALDLTNSKMLGQAFAPYAYLNVPFVKLEHFEMGIRPGIGLAFMTKTYYNTVPEDLKYVPGSIQWPISNGGTGSYTNAYFSTALFLDFPIRDGFTVSMTAGWYHISNGSIRQPNSGFNMINAQLGVKYQPRQAEYKAPETKVPKGLYEDKRWDVEMSVSGGARQAYFADKNTFGVAAVGIAAHYRPWSIFKIGGGIDLFYDGFYRSVCNEFPNPQGAPVTYYGKTYLRESNLENCFRVGVSLQPEFVIGKLSLGLHAGVYLYDPVKNLEPYKQAKQAEAEGGTLSRGVFYSYDLGEAGISQDGWLYTHIVLKYRITKHWFVQAGAKSHFVKVEFFDFGTGIAF